MANLERMLKGYRLTTAEILYHMPDHPGVLQSFTWQNFDVAPHFPELSRFLDFWKREIEGRLHSVTVAARDLLSPAEARFVGADYRLH